MIMETAITGTFESESWVASPDAYTSDDVINAFDKGRAVGEEEGRKSEKSYLEKKFYDNLKLAAENTKASIEIGNSLNIKAIDAYLRSREFGGFEVLITISEKDTAKDEMINMYKAIAELEEKTASEYYSIMFAFASISKTNFNHNLANSDGYFLKFRPKDEAESRGA